jgi:MarR family transcriptional regulator, lower aerobic nicotinate degradation pathway regulator
VSNEDRPVARPPALLRWPTYALGQLHHLAKARIDAALSDADLSLRGHFVLACLDEYGELSQQQVADRIAMDRSDIVKLIDRLEALGQVVRQRDTVDRRRHVLTLTTTGAGAFRQGEQIIEQATGDILSRLTAHERQTLHRLTLQALGEPAAIADQAAISKTAGAKP